MGGSRQSKNTAFPVPGIWGSGSFREVCRLGGFGREGSLRFYKWKGNIYQGRYTNTKYTTQWIFAQLHTQVTTQVKMQSISNYRRFPTAASQTTPPPTRIILILSSYMVLPVLNFTKRELCICTLFSGEGGVCFFGPCSCLPSSKSMCLSLVRALYCPTEFHWRNVPWFIHPSSHWWAFRLFAVWGAMTNKACTRVLVHTALDTYIRVESQSIFRF